MGGMQVSEQEEEVGKFEHPDPVPYYFATQALPPQLQLFEGPAVWNCFLWVPVVMGAVLACADVITLDLATLTKM